MNISKYLVIMIVLLLMSCGPSMNFLPDSVMKLTIGVTTKEQIQSLFGEAKSDEISLIGGLKSEILTYQYMKSPDYAPRHNIKYLYMELVNNKLNGFIYSNSFDNGSTDFDGNLVDSLIVNKTTRDEITIILGNQYSELLLPSNLLKQPMVNGKIPLGAKECMIYTYLYFEDYKPQYKLCVLFFDSNRILLDKFYSQKYFK